MKLRILRVISLFLFLGIFCVIGIACAEKKEVLWDISHFYVYDDTGMMERLPLSNKIAVRFPNIPSDEEKKSFTGKYGTAGVVQDKTDPLLFIFIFPERTDVQNIINALRTISRSETVEAHPVVVKDNMEAIAEGIGVQTKTYFSAGALQARLSLYGKFIVRETKPIKEGFSFFFNSIESPLNIYLLANLVQKDAWVSHAAPVFRYLEPQVSAAIRVEPLTGTLAETRTVTLEIRILNRRLGGLREDFMPRFGEGKFIPLLGAKAPEKILFFTFGEGKRREFQSGRARVITISWDFKLFEVGNVQGQGQGDWTISSSSVVFEEGDNVIEFPVFPASFSVMSVIGSVAITDAPPPKILDVSFGRTPAETAPKDFQAPRYFFDRWFIDAYRMSLWIYRCSILLFGIGLAMIIYFFGEKLVYAFSMKRAHTRQYAEWEREINRAVDQEPAGSYSVFYEVISAALSRVLRVPPHSSVSDITAMGDVIRPSLREDIETLFEMLDVRLYPDFLPDVAHVSELHDACIDFLYALKRHEEGIPDALDY